MIIALFYISDLLFPLWWFLIMRYSMKRGLKAWQAWGVASTLCVTQAYLVSKLIGWNLGGYLIITISLIPELLFGQSYEPTGKLEYLFWVLPPVLLIVVPVMLLFAVGKYRDNNRDFKKKIHEKTA